MRNIIPELNFLPSMFLPLSFGGITPFPDPPPDVVSSVHFTSLHNLELGSYIKGHRQRISDVCKRLKLISWLVFEEVGRI
jgi:hypothetical protein